MSDSLFTGSRRDEGELPTILDVVNGRPVNGERRFCRAGFNNQPLYPYPATKMMWNANDIPICERAKNMKGVIDRLKLLGVLSQLYAGLWPIYAKAPAFRVSLCKRFMYAF